MAVGHHKRPSTAGRPNLDWTRDYAQQDLADFQRFTKENVDWLKSPLGPMAAWPTSLRRMVLVVMADPAPSALLFGGAVEHTAVVYNESFAGLIGQKHPLLQGQLVREHLDELCQGFDVAWERQTERGAPEIIPHQRIRQHRLGFVEEKSYQWKLVPLIGEDGYVEGSVVTVSVETDDALPERRSSTVRELGNVVTNAIDYTAKQTALNIVRLEGHFSGRSCDCAELWQATSQLKQYEARYEKFADLAPVGIAMLNKDHQIEYANNAYHEIMGDDAQSKSLLGSIHPDDAARVEGYFELIPFRDTPFTFECRLRKVAAQPAVSPSEMPPSPTPTSVLASIYMQQNPDTNTVCWIIDITTHKNAEEFLRRRVEEAVEMRRQKEHFIDMISHEIRNPLGAMLHCTDEIIEDMRSPDANADNILEAAQTIEYCSQHIRNIVGDVLTLSKLDSRLVEICPATVRPREIMGNALKIFNGELRAGNIEMTFEEDASMQELQIEQLLIDPTRMLQVLINLVTNAIKVVKGRPVRRIGVRVAASTRKPTQQLGDSVEYISPRQAPKAIDFGIDAQLEEQLWLVISVEDTGPGISPSEMESLCERFAQENPKTESKYGGAGLGLFISRNLTELQGGQIGIATDLGKGSKFVFSVESRRAHGPAARTRSLTLDLPTREANVRGVESPTVPSSPRCSPSNPPMSLSQPARKILVVEDNLINQRVLASQLRKRGYEVSVALHGQEALEILRMTTAAPDSTSGDDDDNEKGEGGVGEDAANIFFDIVLMDIEMPIMDGLSCAQEIRAFETSRNCPGRLPMIAVTANARKEQAQAAYEAGMNAITTKPYRIVELIAQIEQVCNTSE